MSVSAATIDITALPMWVLVVGGIVGLAQVVFEIWVLVRMLRTPSDRLTLGGRKWLWAIIILLVNWIGAILFLALGKKPEQAADVRPAADAGARAATAADELYGPRGGADPR